MVIGIQFKTILFALFLVPLFSYASEKYSVNLMWINRDLIEYQDFIYPGSEQKVRDKFLKPILGWASLNRDATVAVWYDSALTPPPAVKRTRKLIEQMASSESGLAPVELKDIRELPQVQFNTKVFSAAMPVYFRADLLRVIASYNEISSGTLSYFVYADLDVTPLSKEELFDSETVAKLDRFGIVMAQGRSYGEYENSFHIIRHGNRNLLEAVNWALIELNIKRAENALFGRFYDDRGRSSLREFTEAVYESYDAMFMYFYHLEGLGKMTIDGEPYNKLVHGLEPFGLDRLARWLRFSSSDTTLVRGVQIIMIPKKEVDVPPASGNYD